MKIKLINWEALNYQISVHQPTFWDVFKVSVAFTFFNESSQCVLIYFSKIPTGNALPLFQIGWFVVLFGLWTVMAFSFKHEYPAALKCPQLSIPNRCWLELVVVLFAAAFLFTYGFQMWKLYQNLLHLISISNSQQGQQLLQQTILKVHAILWGQVNCGTDKLGVVLGSLTVLLCPIFEELFFRGYMVNCLCQRFHPLTAVCMSAFLFTLCHILSKTLDELPKIFLLGLCCGIVRLWTGRWQDALKLHFIYNFCIIAPKIGFAIYRFHTLPS
jgi:membrane protease YdiL (CAAX protease family)